MIVEQIYTGCIAEAAYYIESKGEVAIIDPLRETEPYLKMAEERGGKIKYIFETHFHADFVSGHIDLAKKTGAEIIYGPTANPTYDVIVGEDNQEFKIGDIAIKLLHTPGHTLESTTFLLIDEHGKEQAIFSGDTLFLGDVGRPDLAIKSDLTREDLAGMLFDSLRNQIMPLADDITVYPGHGAGSSCGKNMSTDTVDTLGNQKKVNYALRADMTKKEFINEVCDGILPPPQYFAKNAMLNKTGYDNVDQVMAKGNVSLNLDEFESLRKESKTIVIDTRSEQAFSKSHIPGSLFISLEGSFAMWVGALVRNLDQKILLITDIGREEEAVRRLARVGYDHALGHLQGGFTAWEASQKPVESLRSVSAHELEVLRSNQDLNIVDVRKPGEFDAEHLDGATSFPLDFINGHLGDLDKDESYYLHCQTGFRSVTAMSILRMEGYTNIIDIQGGFEEIKKTSIPTTDYVCPTTLK